ncbi:cytochrome C biogenesis protein [Ammoniphilus oxalaticus]|uniref:Cytochrome C biogenesis protein n=1 Tax=Ammoniphilus oxalaticus TaxID=66863 RepID=A0A419SLP3_9BACL|nr:TlpA family protein disulfide reductase [Ammoniphilus oxalaticus]RKD25003.1 cytochrome C biogenesis protein [Ammoniphilus oxalaticus]
MNKNMIAILALLGLVAWGIFDMGKSNSGSEELSVQEESQAPIGLAQGYLAPDFELETIDGNKVKLSDYRGKKVLLNMWASWCPPCRAEIPDMQQFYEQNVDQNVVVLGVNLTSAERQPERIPRFIEEFGMTFPIVLDEQSNVSDRYQVSSIPTSFILDSQGVIQQKIVGPMDREMMEQLMFSID